MQIKLFDFLSFSMFGNLSELISNNVLYNLCDEWVELKKLFIQEILLSAGVPYASRSVSKTLIVARPQPPQLGVAALHKTEIVVLLPDSQSASA